MRREIVTTTEEIRCDICDKDVKEDNIIEFKKEEISRGVYDYFINHGIQKILSEEPEIVIEQPNIKYSVSFSDVYVSKPTITEEDRNLRNVIYPSECRQRDLTYDSPVYVTVTEKTEIPGKPIEIKKHYRM
jgi:DNA-directed RNA polymerase beta subunit